MEELTRHGKWMVAADVTGEMNRIVAEMVRIFEGCFPDLASAVAAKFQLSQREVLHLLRSEFRQAREQLVATSQRGSGQERVMNPFLAPVRGPCDPGITDGFQPTPPVDFEKWAIDTVSFSDRESQFPGPYNPNRFRPFTEIYKALRPEDPCRIVTFSKGAQIGGTIIATVFCLRQSRPRPGWTSSTST